MIIEHPWKSYATIAGLSTAIYYAVIGWQYYLPEIKSWLGQRHKPVQLREINSPSSDTTEESVQQEIDESELVDDLSEAPEWQSEEMFETAEKLSTHLISEIEEAHSKEYSKPDLILMMQMILKNYSVLKGTPFQKVINNRIESECAKYGSIHLSEGEMIEVWRKV
ncbi:hypothetical protein [Dyadobacter jiangsuensis]|uniref:Uncharacterized protein n=1 Tax=Dyadobacter jiangsuensis TaxID=1591085 RepID=A0A2P8FA65_9BACT|nr:hypothetical protein [Dyadobacter jiangsuensis]PSL18600.1 hypothetical protein CLV60_13027 [Dyadobacter jiangsuensis]